MLRKESGGVLLLRCRPPQAPGRVEPSRADPPPASLTPRHARMPEFARAGQGGSHSSAEPQPSNGAGAETRPSGEGDSPGRVSTWSLHLQGSVFQCGYRFDPQGPNPVLDRKCCCKLGLAVSVPVGSVSQSIPLFYRPTGDRNQA